MRNREHLRRLDRVWIRGPVFLVTGCAKERRRVLAPRPLTGDVLECLAEARYYHNWMVGGYVVMPDHVHFFCTPRERDWNLSDFVGRFNSRSTRAGWQHGIKGALWQQDFHDHLLRSNESYSRKWTYVQRNPVRAGLCGEMHDWPWVGEMDQFRS